MGYEIIIEHLTAYTGQEEAAASHISGYESAKTVIHFRDDDEPIMAVLLTTYHVDEDRLAELVGTGSLRRRRRRTSPRSIGAASRSTCAARTGAWGR